MQVFHGSYTEIVRIDLSKSRANKDFGRGFYATKFRPQAAKWAAIVGKINHKKPVVTEFIFHERAFEDKRYKTLRFNEYNEAWLDFKEETHQICFCTVNSLQMLQKTDTKFSLLVARISEPIIENLITEFDFSEEKAADSFYTSKTFSKLSDKHTGLYLSSWQDVYEMLREEEIKKQSSPR